MADKTNTVNISFRSDLLKAIDKVAKEESRSRSELIREAARMYIERKGRWDTIFRSVDQAIAARKIAELDVLNEVAEFRNSRHSKR